MSLPENSSSLDREYVIHRMEQLSSAQSAIEDEILQVRNKCPHEWRYLRTANDHDGWSVNVDVEWSTYYDCPICGASKTDTKTSRTR